MNEYDKNQQDLARQEHSPPGYDQEPLSGCVQNTLQKQQNRKDRPLYPRDHNGKLLGAAYAWMTITTILMIIMIFPTYGILVIGLAWCIPMMILIRRVRDGKMRNTVWFGVICLFIAGIIPVGFGTFAFWWGVGLLFATGIIPGILLLIAEKDEKIDTAGQ